MNTRSSKNIWTQKEVLFLLIAALAIFLLRVPGLYQPILDMDESVFSEFANIMLNGGLPYIDTVDNKPPAMYGFFALIYACFGTGNLIAVHLVTTLLVAATAGMLYRIARLFTSFSTGAAAVLFFIFLTHIHEPKYISTNGETLINLLLVSSIYFYLANRFRPFSFLRSLTAGLLLGTAVLTSYKAGIVALLFIFDMFLLAIHKKDNGTPGPAAANGIKNFLITGLSSLLPVAAALFIFYNNGALRDFLYWGFTYNFGYIESGAKSFSVIQPLLRTLIFSAMASPLLYIMVKGSVLRRQADLQESDPGKYYYIFSAAWLILSLVAVLQGGRCYSHYYIQLAPPLALLAAPLVHYFYQGRQREKKILTAAFCILILIAAMARINIRYTYQLVHYPNRQAETALEAAGKYIKDKTADNETIYAWGWATPVYHYAKRRSASRFLISDYISGRIFGTGNHSSLVNKKETMAPMKELFISDLKKNRPAYIIDTSPAGFYGYDRFPLSDFPAMQTIIKKEYSLEVTIQGMKLYRRN